MNLDRLKGQLRTDEDVRSKVYFDSLGIPTIGVGRNIRDKGLSQAEIDFLLSNDINDARQDALSLAPNLNQLNDVRQEVLINMAFNMGKSRLAGFKKMLAAIAIRDFNTAATEMLDSTWAKQVGKRAIRLSNAMRTGSF